MLDAAEAAFLQHPDEVEPLLNADARRAARSTGSRRSTCTTSRSTRRSPTPSLHEPGDGGDVVVGEVLRTGYRWKGKVAAPGDGAHHAIETVETAGSTCIEGGE